MIGSRFPKEGRGQRSAPTAAGSSILNRKRFYPWTPSDPPSNLPESERRLAAIMFTDMVGYTVLGQRNESLALALLEEQRNLIRPILRRHNGREVKTIGDAFLVEFSNAIDSVRCAYDIQRATRELNFSLTSDKRIHLRIGLHLGEVVESQGDISGDAVNLASRIEALADDGGVCLTQQVYDHVRNKFGLSLTSIGSKLLKNVIDPIEVYKMQMPWDLKPAFGQPTETDRKRIAVLPLQNISVDPNDEYFAEGMTEEMIGVLSRVEGLRVIAKTSVTRYKGSSKPVSEIGKELAVGSIVEGSVRKAGNRIRVAAQLIDTTTEEHLWSENYDRKVEDIFAIQSEIAVRVADALRARLQEHQRKKLESGYTRNSEAYEKYLLARYSTTSDPFTRIRYLEEAIRLDPGFALAYATLANYYVILSGDWVSPKEAYSKAGGFVLKALELDATLSLAWVAKGNLVFQGEWDSQKAEDCFTKAIEMNPSDDQSYFWYGWLCFTRGRYEQALELELKGRELNPYPRHPSAYGFVAVTYAAMGKTIEAQRECQRLRDFFPGHPDVHNYPAIVYGIAGETTEAIRELNQLRAEIKVLRERGAKGWTAGVFPTYYALNALNYSANGEFEEIRTMVKEAEIFSNNEYVSSHALGVLYLALGDTNKAFALFDKAIEDKDAAMFINSREFSLLLRRTPLESVRSDPRFNTMLSRIGLN